LKQGDEREHREDDEIAENLFKELRGRYAVQQQQQQQQQQRTLKALLYFSTFELFMLARLFSIQIFMHPIGNLY
jgi:hypothetical protein